MKMIQGICRHQMQFTSLDEQVAADNAVRIIDVFVEKLDLKKLGVRQQQLQRKPGAGGAPPLMINYC